MDIQRILTAMRADQIPEGWSGRWYIKKLSIPAPALGMRDGRPVRIPAGSFTFLRCLTDATLYDEPPGEIVMEDSPFELKTHLGFILQARGRVLVTGLGLGCVVRGLLENPQVESVTVIEKSRNVLALVEPYMPRGRVSIIEADALEWTAQNQQPFDCAWHDLWTNAEAGEPHLDIWHANLFANCRKTVRQQGAWSFDRSFRRLLRSHGLQWIG